MEMLGDFDKCAKRIKDLHLEQCKKQQEQSNSDSDLVSVPEQLNVSNVENQKDDNENQNVEKMGFDEDDTFAINDAIVDHSLQVEDEHVVVDAELVKSLFVKSFCYLYIMHNRVNLVHGDFSEYNLL
eukprot:CAMPEP_0116897850 /NCGR_PEP_ID=MMETSP0467-20121206/6715_1 /TAXON_ID=283647 /ORGANISM="Mesodinium pulex, Strain SPMC105" /LENGTH=126 /DNA_ID=CAMNT_0004569675 /DNA_START=592 /DNA_END=975 /DNA_ORIENTATION=-